MENRSAERPGEKHLNTLKGEDVIKRIALHGDPMAQLECHLSRIESVNPKMIWGDWITKLQHNQDPHKALADFAKSYTSFSQITDLGRTWRSLHPMAKEGDIVAKLSIRKLRSMHPNASPTIDRRSPVPLSTLQDFPKNLISYLRQAEGAASCPKEELTKALMHLSGGYEAYGIYWNPQKAFSLLVTLSESDLRFISPYKISKIEYPTETETTKGFVYRILGRMCHQGYDAPYDPKCAYDYYTQAELCGAEVSKEKKELEDTFKKAGIGLNEQASSHTHRKRVVLTGLFSARLV